MFLTRLLLFQTPCSYFAVRSEKFPEIFLFVIDVVLLEVSVTIPEDLVLAVHAVVVPLALVDVSFTRVILFIDRNRVVHTLPLVNLLGSYEKMHWPSLYLLTYLMLSYRVSNTVSILAVIFPVALENFAEGVVELALAVGAVVNIIALVDVFVEVNESVVSVGYIVPLVNFVLQPVDPDLPALPCRSRLSFLNWARKMLLFFFLYGSRTDRCLNSELCRSNVKLNSG